ncbi:LysR family transcriptional regulator [Aestuariicoccus sp. MJ-SS9]|uniref:LysR family transcriptional regulator n=1 Tax=Aestuariicoccus sp. MJ-SS9 TaxID=3079855 RepID=UPI00290BCE80|nr:LysR family transcriptional regulator [Aestuariicoccus sp. MJ-SS9]MDU8909745.1 LysR substrate-binding domain-containing protein [Aestuariicoccus sp. MJ-SS9]
MDLLLIRDLERLRQTGNFSQAAALGNLSQPAFSRRIKALEAWVGVTLVDRSRQPVRLTEAGAQILEAGLQASARIEQERSQILEAQSLPDKYVVTFAAQHSIGWRFYPAWLQGLEDAYGPILSRLRADDLPNCMRDLKNGSVDFVIAYQRADAPRGMCVDSIAIGDDQLIPVCKPDAEGLPLFRFDTPGVKMPYLRFGDAAPIGAHLEPLFLDKLLSRRLQTVYENSMAGALRIRARAGDGVAWLPRSLVAPDVDSGILVQAGEPDWIVDLSIRLFRNTERSNRTTRSIWSFLEVRQSVSLLPEA